MTAQSALVSRTLFEQFEDLLAGELTPDEAEDLLHCRGMLWSADGVKLEWIAVVKDGEPGFGPKWGARSVRRVVIQDLHRFDDWLRRGGWIASSIDTWTAVLVARQVGGA